jgi:hypothetical protein
MNKNIQTNENGADKSPSPLEQQALLRDVDYCFGLFLNRLKDEEAEGYEPAELNSIEEIYAAFDAAISFDDKSQLIALLRRQVPIPHEFLILLADVMEGEFRLKGKPKKLSHGYEIHYYIEMCKVQQTTNKPSLEDMFNKLSNELMHEGHDVSPDTLRRVWRSCEKDPWLKQKFGNGGKR